jgi:hypothetical protein
MKKDKMSKQLFNSGLLRSVRNDEVRIKVGLDGQNKVKIKIKDK